MTVGVEPARAAPQRGQVVRELALYFALAFALAWGIGVGLIFARPQVEALIGPIGQLNHHWLYFIGVYAPTLSAIICSLVFAGSAGLKALARRFTRPFNPIWLAVSILYLPTAYALAGLAANAVGAKDLFDLHAIIIGAPLLAVTTLALLTDPGGLGEELGWRGFALPRLLTLMRPLYAALVLGFIWGLWHLPAFFLSDLAQSRLGLGWFLGGSMGLSVVMTWLFIRANGNVIVAGTIPHLMSNLLSDAHAQPKYGIEVETIILAIIVIALLVRYGRDLAPRAAPATAVVAPSAAG